MRAAVQVLKKTEDLKQQTSGDFLNDNDAWNRHRKLQELYRQLLVVDLEYALDKKVEQDLWNHVFKNHINRLQSQAKDRKNPQRIESQENLVWFLETASGFYLQLLQELCETFDLDVPCRRKGSVYGISKEIKPISCEIALPQKSSSLYICQHCLVHMGDIARYRNQSLQAETFYRHAADLIPSNGQPYNQLAILEAAKGDKLSTVFYYVRSIAVKHPFPVAMTNLQKMYSKIVNDEFPCEGKTKLSVYDYVSAFLQFHTLIHLTTDLEKARHIGKTLATNLTILIATESLSAWKLIQMMAINLFAVEHATHSLLLIDANSSTTTTTTLETMTTSTATDTILSEQEQTAYSIVLELIASTLNGILLLVYTMKGETELRSYYALPVLKIAFDWLRQNPSHLKAVSFTSKFQIWPSFCKLLNSIQISQGTGVDLNKYAWVPLPEDWDLQSFLPLHLTHRSYRFDEPFQPNFTTEDELNLRTYRLVLIGQWLCEQQVYGVKLMTSEMEKTAGGNIMKFEAVTPQTPSTDVLKLLEEMTIGIPIDESIPMVTTANTDRNNHREENGLKIDNICRESNGNATGLSSVTNSNGQYQSAKRDDCEITPTNKDASMTNRTASTVSMTVNATRRTRQNVALQTFMQKKNLGSGGDEDAMKPSTKSEGKMVTFKTPSPSPPASSNGGTPPLSMIHSSQYIKPVFQPTSVTPTPHQFKPPTSTAKFPSSFGNGVEANSILSTVSRNPYSGAQTLENQAGYSMNQVANKLHGGFYGVNNVSPPNYPPLMFGSGGALRPPPVRGDQINGCQSVLSHLPSTTPPPPPPLLMNYNQINNYPINRQQQPMLHGLPVVQNRNPIVHAALANQKQASFLQGVNSPPPPPWFHKKASTNLDQQFMSQMSAGGPGQMVPPQPYPYNVGPTSRNQQFPSPVDSNHHLVYQMLGSQFGDPFTAYHHLHPPPSTNSARVPLMSDLIQSADMNLSGSGNGTIGQLAVGNGSNDQLEQQRNLTESSSAIKDERRLIFNNEISRGDEMMSTNTYSLFNSPWSSGLNVNTGSAGGDSGSVATPLSTDKDKTRECYETVSTTKSTTSSVDDLKGFLQPGIQSLWSGAGPSPLERLLEQQKLKKDTVPH